MSTPWGFSPGVGEPEAAVRTVKAEYVFLPYQPEFAIFTGTSLHLQSSSTDVMGAYGVPPELAAVHTNGDLSTTGGPNVTGPVTYSGSYGGGVTFGQGPAQKVDTVPMPRVSAMAFYGQAAGMDPAAMASWRDLCPDGAAYRYSSNGPCTGTKIANAPYNGWSYKSSTHTWTASKDTTPGTYFVHQANVTSGNGNGSIANITVIASATSSDCSTKQYGNIEWSHYDTPAPAFKNLFFLADGDLSTTSNFYSGQSSPSNVVSGDVRRR